MPIPVNQTQPMPHRCIGKVSMHEASSTQCLDATLKSLDLSQTAAEVRYALKQKSTIYLCVYRVLRKSSMYLCVHCAQRHCARQGAFAFELLLVIYQDKHTTLCQAVKCLQKLPQRPWVCSGLECRATVVAFARKTGCQVGGSELTVVLCNVPGHQTQPRRQILFSTS